MNAFPRKTPRAIASRVSAETLSSRAIPAAGEAAREARFSAGLFGSGRMRIGDMADYGLRGRRSECARLDGLLTGVRAGHSAALVMRGEAGVGKTALLDYLAGSAAESAGAAGGGGGVGDGAGVRRAAPDVRAGPGSPQPAAGTAACRARDRVRPAGRAAAGSFPDRPGRAQLAGRGGRGWPAGVRDRRCAMAGPGVETDAGVRGPPAGGRIGADDLRRAGTRCGS